MLIKNRFDAGFVMPAFFTSLYDDGRFEKFVHRTSRATYGLILLPLALLYLSLYIR